MRPLPLACAALVAMFLLGCGPTNDKPIPVNTEGGEPAATDQPADAAATAETPPPADDVNADETQMAADIAQHDEAFKAALGSLAEAMQQDIAMAKEMQSAEAMAMEKLGGALSEEVAEREKQAMMVAGEVINDLKAKGYDVHANVIELDKTAVPEAAKPLLDSLKVGDTSKIFEWNNGYGVVRKMSESDTMVKVGYIWATKEAAMGPAAAAPADGTTTTSPDGATSTGDGTTTEGGAADAPAEGGH